MIHHKAVQAPKRRHGCCDQSCTVFRCSQLLPDTAAHVLSAALLRQRQGLVFSSTIAEDNTCSHLPKHPYCSRTNSTRAAGNQCHSSGK
jgi:hypothetical protein